MMTNRQPAGVPVGGQFAAENRARAGVSLNPAPERRNDMRELRWELSGSGWSIADSGSTGSTSTYRLHDGARRCDVVVTDTDITVRDPRRPELGVTIPRGDDGRAFVGIVPALVQLEERLADAPMSGPEPETPARPAPKKVTDLTNREHATLGRMKLGPLRAVMENLERGPAEGFRETGPAERATILSQIGDGPTGNVAAISGHRVVPLPDGVELPVSSGVKVRVRLAADDTYTVQRVRVLAQAEKILGQRESVYADNLPTVAYRAGMYKSYGTSEEW